MATLGAGEEKNIETVGGAKILRYFSPGRDVPNVQRSAEIRVLSHFPFHSEII